jgi:hypothetical protein
MWARLAGLMYLLVLVVDLTGMQFPRAPLGRSLILTGSVLTVPLALGLYFTLRIFQPNTARVALACRLIEAATGILGTMAGFRVVWAGLAASHPGTAILQFVAWNKATNFGALIFTIGSTLFFFLFVQSASIPRFLSWLGLVASLIALGACAAHLIRPQFPAMSIAAWIPMLLAEVSTGGWLLIRAVDPVLAPASTLHRRGEETISPG